MKPFIKDVSIVEYYVNYKKNLLTKVIQDAENIKNDIFSHLHENKIIFSVNKSSFLIELLTEKQLQFIYKEDSVELIDIKKRKIFRDVFYNYADITVESNFKFTIKIYDKSYLKFCERLSKMLVDFGEVLMQYEGPKNINLNSFKYRRKRKDHYYVL